MTAASTSQQVLINAVVSQPVPHEGHTGFAQESIASPRTFIPPEALSMMVREERHSAGPPKELQRETAVAHADAPAAPLITDADTLDHGPYSLDTCDLKEGFSCIEIVGGIPTRQNGDSVAAAHGIVQGGRPE